MFFSYINAFDVLSIFFLTKIEMWHTSNIDIFFVFLKELYFILYRFRLQLFAIMLRRFTITFCFLLPILNFNLATTFLWSLFSLSFSLSLSEVQSSMQLLAIAISVHAMSNICTDYTVVCCTHWTFSLYIRLLCLFPDPDISIFYVPWKFVLFCFVPPKF